MSKYIKNGLPWSSGIGTKVEETATSREVIEQAGLNFIVQKCELTAKIPFSINGNNNVNEEDGEFVRQGNIYKPLDNAFATYRTDMNIPLGLVKSKYEVVQNIDAFNFFDDAIGIDKALWQYAGFYGIGQKVFIVAKLPVQTNVGSLDPIDNYLVFSNSHDGSSSIDILFTPIRVFCTNCLNSAYDSASSHIRLRHTPNVKDKIQQGAQVLRIACEYAKNAEDIYNSIYYINMTDNDVMKYIASIVLTDKEIDALNTYDPKTGYSKLFAVDYRALEETKISTRKANQLHQMFEYYLDGIGQQKIAGTAWGAYNAITGYYSNVANFEGEKRMDSLLYGNASKNMSKALYNAVRFAA